MEIVKRDKINCLVEKKKTRPCRVDVGRAFKYTKNQCYYRNMAIQLFKSITTSLFRTFKPRLIRRHKDWSHL